VVITTPQTALKCVETLKDYKFVIIDEVHHAFGNKFYVELITKLRPEFLFGFSALIPKRKKFRIPQEFVINVGEPKYYEYDYAKLVEIDREFKLPNVILDMFDSEFNEAEKELYERLLFEDIDGRTRYHLEKALASYGIKAFLESYENVLRKGNVTDILEGIHQIRGLSHKARTVLEVLEAYDVQNSPELWPILIFTSRKVTAKEIEKAIRSNFNLRVAVITGDTSKEDRLRIISRAKRGIFQILVLTIVGEEGLDVPTAGLLIMTDIRSKSETAFYQRLGRLIRPSQRTVKYLAVTLTPGTREYNDLEIVLEKLKKEGVDIDSIFQRRLEDILEKGLSKTIYERIESVYEKRGSLCLFVKLLLEMKLALLKTA